LHPEYPTLIKRVVDGYILVVLELSDSRLASLILSQSFLRQKGYFYEKKIEKGEKDVVTLEIVSRHAALILYITPTRNYTFLA